MKTILTRRLRQIKGKAEELGFGTKDTGQTDRLLNHDGTFNVIRKGIPVQQRFRFYHFLVALKWNHFILIVSGGFIIINLFFTLLYISLGRDSLNGLEAPNDIVYFIEVFSFSAQSFTTVGYGRINPHGWLPDVISSIESLFGLMSFALATGLIYGRFARPQANFLFSNCMVVAPFRDKSGLMFRVVNKLNHQVTELEAEINFSILQDNNGTSMRNYFNLPLQLKKVSFFPANWTVNHIIDEHSPVYGLTPEDFETGDAEILIMMKGFDENFSQTIYVRNSYRWSEVKWGYKFSNMTGQPENGKSVLQLDKISSIEIAPLSIEKKIEE